MRVWIFLALLVALLVSVYSLMGLRPPKTMTLAAGPEGGAYSQIAEKYRSVLARDGISIELVETQGSVENARLISEGQVDAAILQGGITVANPQVETLGALFFEPMVFLVRPDSKIRSNPALWQNLRINIGPAGSGTAAAFHDFERATGLEPGKNQLLGLSYDKAIAALRDGNVDMAVFVAPIDAPYLLTAQKEASVRYLRLDYAEAISRRLEYAKTVTVPTGAVSLAPVIPSSPKRLVALEARMAISPKLHPALINRLTMAAIEIHSSRGMIRNNGTFPSVDGTGLPVNKIARQLIINGPSIWHDWLPYWIASQFQRLLLLMLPILFIVLPALRALPQLYAYMMRWRVWKLYPEIREIESQLQGTDTDTDLSRMDSQLVALDEQLSQIRLPAAYRQTAYDARLHLELVRKRIAKLRQTLQPENLQ